MSTFVVHFKNGTRRRLEADTLNDAQWAAFRRYGAFVVILVTELKQQDDDELVPGERVVDGERLYSAAWLNEDAIACGRHADRGFVFTCGACLALNPIDPS